MFEKEAQKIKKIGEKYELELILVFGSQLTGKTHKKSDVDIAVKVKENSQIKDIYLDLCEDLQRIFPGKKIDLAFVNLADPLFLKKISENCSLVFGDNTKFNEFKLYAYKRYIDHKKYLKMEEDYVKRVISRAKSA